MCLACTALTCDTNLSGAPILFFCWTSICLTQLHAERMVDCRFVEWNTFSIVEFWLLCLFVSSCAWQLHIQNRDCTHCVETITKHCGNWLHSRTIFHAVVQHTMLTFHRQVHWNSSKSIKCMSYFCGCCCCLGRRCLAPLHCRARSRAVAKTHSTQLLRAIAAADMRWLRSILRPCKRACSQSSLYIIKYCLFVLFCFFVCLFLCSREKNIFAGSYNMSVHPPILLRSRRIAIAWKFVFFKYNLLVLLSFTIWILNNVCGDWGVDCVLWAVRTQNVLADRIWWAHSFFSQYTRCRRRFIPSGNISFLSQTLHERTNTPHTHIIHMKIKTMHRKISVTWISK